MVDRDIVLEKIGQIQNCLKRIREKTKGDETTLENLDTQDIFVLNLQRAIQSSLDLAAHIISDEGLGLPDDLRANFILLEKAGIIGKTLSDHLQNMVGFRNIAVHEYSLIDVEILKSILSQHLKDLEVFYAAVLKHFKMAGR